jgi:pimeloyl-ACP methyl ester carboxylesterase
VTHEVKSKDGTPIAWFESGSGPALVLVHGTTADHARWTPVLEDLEARFTVHAMDRRGRGASGDGPTYAIEREHEDVAAVVDAIAERTSEPVFLLGHSYGALCSLEAALLTTNVRKLVLYEPPIPAGLPLYEPELLERLDEMLSAGRMEDVVLTFFREVPRIPAADDERVVIEVVGLGGEVAAAEHRAERDVVVRRADRDPHRGLGRVVADGAVAVLEAVVEADIEVVDVMELVTPDADQVNVACGCALGYPVDGDGDVL